MYKPCCDSWCRRSEPVLSSTPQISQFVPCICHDRRSSHPSILFVYTNRMKGLMPYQGSQGLGMCSCPCGLGDGPCSALEAAQPPVGVLGRQSRCSSRVVIPGVGGASPCSVLPCRYCILSCVSAMTGDPHVPPSDLHRSCGIGPCGSCQGCRSLPPSGNITL